MNFGDSAARVAVAAAVTLLPARLRDRYREQWHADLRDAAEAGVRRSEVAWGSLAFAITVNRTAIELERTRAPEVVLGRERLASGLALGAAVVALTHVGTVVGFSWNAGFGAVDFVLAFSAFLLAAYLAVAPIAAATMVAVTRGIRPGVRWAVWLLVLASFAHLSQVLVDGGGAAGGIYTARGMAAYGIAAVLTVVAIVLLARAFRPATAIRRKRPLAAAVGAILVFAVAGAGLENLRSLLAMQRAARAAFIDDYGPAAAARLADLNAGLAAAERGSATAVTLWGVVAFAAVFGIALFGFVRGSSRLGAVARPAAAICVLMVAHASVTVFVRLMSVGAFTLYLPVPDVLLIAGRCGLIAVALLTVGGVRFRRARRRGLVTVHSEA